MSVSIKAPDENPSNVESILSDTIGLPGYTINPPGSRIEELLIELNELIKSGGDSDAYATDLSLTIDSSTYVITAVLKNQNGESIGTPQTIDLPMESVVVSGSYNSQTKKVVLTLQNGSTIEFSVADLIDGLQAEITSANKLNADLVDDSTSTNKFVTSADKSAWNSKQNALVVGTNLDDEPIEDSTNPITSGGVFDTVGNLDAALDSLIMSLEPKTITANGTYDPADDGVDGYSSVTVNVESVEIYKLSLSGNGISDNNVYYTFFNNQLHVFGYFQSTGASGTYNGYFTEKSLAELGVPTLGASMPVYCANFINYGVYGNNVYSGVDHITLNVTRIDNGRITVVGVATWAG